MTGLPKALTEIDLKAVTYVLELFHELKDHEVLELFYEEHKEDPIDRALTIEIAGIWMAFRDRAALRPRVYMKIVEMGEVSPKLVAKALGEPIGNISYHMRAMTNEGHICLTRTKAVRGSVEHFYKAMKEW